MFLRNHDELTLEMVTDDERDYMYRIYAADPRVRLNLGIRRRLAPLMENDRRRIELLNSLLLSMPGTPVIYYGDEIGMGDNIYPRRPQWRAHADAVERRTAMRGFSRADPQRLYLPPIMDPIYGYQAINVEAQSRDLIAAQLDEAHDRTCASASQAFGRGTHAFSSPAIARCSPSSASMSDETILCVANLSRSAQPVELDLAGFIGRSPIELLAAQRLSADRRPARIC